MASQTRNPLRSWRSTLNFIIQKTKIVLVCFVLLYAFLFLLRKTSTVRLSYNPLGGELVDKYLRLEVKDWGFNGQPVVLNNLTNYQRALIDRSIQLYQMNAWLSERIPLRRTLPDFRDKRCSNFTSDVELRRASIIITHRDDHPSVLLRCLYSIFMRSLHDNIKDVILVDIIKDHEKSKNTGISALVYAHFGRKVRYLEIDAATEEAAARAYGARHAKGEVFVFLESSIEVTVGWLPALLAPIAADVRVVTVPTLDEIHYNTFAYKTVTSERGGFNWKFFYKYLPLLDTQIANYPAPYENPVMNGPAFAIDARWYWELSPYDVGLMRWGGEKFELSFMIWMCRGLVLEVPCSRIGYLHKEPITENFNLNDTYRNYKRMAEVWLDEYKELLYKYRNVLLNVSAGDLSHQHYFRKEMKCKPFKWYLTNVMPDFMKAFPPKFSFTFAHGIMKFLGNAEYCLTMTTSTHEHEGTQVEKKVALLDSCPKAPKIPTRYDWTVGRYLDIRQGSDCLEFDPRASRPVPVVVQPCHEDGHNQLWYYSYQTQTIQNGETSTKKLCLQGNAEYYNIFVRECDYGNPNQRWIFSYYNKTALDRFRESLKQVNTDL